MPVKLKVANSNSEEFEASFQDLGLCHELGEGDFYIGYFNIQSYAFISRISQEEIDIAKHSAQFRQECDIACLEAHGYKLIEILS